MDAGNRRGSKGGTLVQWFSLVNTILALHCRKTYLAIIFICLALAGITVVTNRGGAVGSARHLTAPVKRQLQVWRRLAKQSHVGIGSKSGMLPVTEPPLKGTTSPPDVASSWNGTAPVQLQSPRHRLVLFWTTMWSSSFATAMNDNFPPSGRCAQLCTTTYDKERVREADVILFHAADIRAELPSVRTSAQLWVLFNLEPPTQGYVLPSNDGLFNLTMTYRSDSDIVVSYGYTESLVENAENGSSSAAWLKLPKALSNATNFANRKPYAYWLASNCANPRMAYVKELAKYIRIDIFGKCDPEGVRVCNSTRNGTTESDCEAELSATYVFYLAFENSRCTDYVTEKLWRTLASPGGAIPVVLGASPPRYAEVAPPGSFVHAESFASLHELAAHLTLVASDRELFMSYHRWRERYQVHVGWYDEFSRGLCRLFEQMNNNEIRQSPARVDLYKWFSSGCEEQWPLNG